MVFFLIKNFYKKENKVTNFKLKIQEISDI